MDTSKKNTAGGAKKGPSKLPSKQISFSGQQTFKNGKQAKQTVSTGKKGGVNLMKKLSGM